MFPAPDTEKLRPATQSLLVQTIGSAFCAGDGIIGGRILHSFGRCVKNRQPAFVPSSATEAEFALQWFGARFRITSDRFSVARAILLVGGDKTGDQRWYEVHVPRADKLYEEHLDELERQGKKEESQHG